MADAERRVIGDYCGCVGECEARMQLQACGGPGDTGMLKVIHECCRQVMQQSAGSEPAARVAMAPGRLACSAVSASHGGAATAVLPRLSQIVSRLPSPSVQRATRA